MRRRERAARPAGGTVRVGIERLVLHGVTATTAGRLAGALRMELAAFAARPGARFASIVAARIRAAPIALGNTPEQTGRALAAALWSGIAGPEYPAAGQTGQKGRAR